MSPQIFKPPCIFGFEPWCSEENPPIFRPFKPPECKEGETKCEGYDLYVCENGKWVLKERNSPQCGYTPPPTPCSGYIGVIDARKTDSKDFECLGSHEASGGLTIIHKKSITYHGKVYTADDNEKYHIEISDTLGHKLSADVINGAFLQEFMSTGTYHMLIVDEKGKKLEGDVGVSPGQWTTITFTTDYGVASEPEVVFTSNRKSFRVILMDLEGNVAYDRTTTNGEIKITGIKYGNYEVYAVMGGEVISALISFTKPKDFPFHTGKWEKHYSFSSNTGMGTLEVVNCNGGSWSLTLDYRAAWEKGSWRRIPDEVKKRIGATITIHGTGISKKVTIPAGEYYVKNTSGKVIGEVFIYPDKKSMIDITSGSVHIIGYETTAEELCKKQRVKVEFMVV